MTDVSIIEDEVIAVTGGEEIINVEVTEPLSISVVENDDGSPVTVNEEVVGVTVENDDIEVVLAGIPGPAGPRGESGLPGRDAAGASLFAERSFVIPEKEWIFEHNLGYTPAVSLFDTVGTEIEGTVTENTVYRTVVSFWFPVAGRIACS